MGLQKKERRLNRKRKRRARASQRSSISHFKMIYCPPHLSLSPLPPSFHPSFPQLLLLRGKPALSLSFSPVRLAARKERREGRKEGRKQGRLPPATELRVRMERKKEGKKDVNLERNDFLLLLLRSCVLAIFTETDRERGEGEGVVNSVGEGAAVAEPAYRSSIQNKKGMFQKREEKSRIFLTLNISHITSDLPLTCRLSLYINKEIYCAPFILNRRK